LSLFAPPSVTGLGGSLPVTGMSLPLYVGGGVALLLVGAGAVWLTRRRVRIEA
jgi:LPXTG-motif cell wall-anchored protein